MENQNEIWKDIKGYEGKYKISNFGNVISLSRKIKCRNGYRITVDKIMKPCKYKKGYLSIELGYRNRYLLHRLVALTFLENKLNKPCVNHINGIKTDNNINNLEWVTYSENEIHSRRILNKKPICGESHKRSKLTEKQVIEIKTRIKNGEKNKDIYKDYNVTDRNISDIRHNKRWKHIKI